MKARRCKWCREAYTPTSSTQRYCKSDCVREALNLKSREAHARHKAKMERLKLPGGKVARICITCGKEYKRYSSQVKWGGTDYCSKKCHHGNKPKLSIANLDADWAKLIKLRSGGKCEYCGKDSGLNAHHIFSRSNYSTRWDVNNGISLCVSHHTFSSGFSAHKTPAEFVEWIKEYRGADWYDMLRKKAKEIYKPDYEEVAQYLLKAKNEASLTIKQV